MKRYGDSTLMGPVEVISWNEFVNRIGKTVDGSESKHTHYIYFALDSGPPFGEDSAPLERRYQARKVPYMSGNGNELVKMQLQYMARARMPMMAMVENLRDVLYEAIVEFCEDFGEDPVLVRLAPRTWFLANPRDYVLASGPQGYALGCFAPGRLHIYHLGYNSLKRFFNQPVGIGPDARAAIDRECNETEEPK